ncbi:MAG: ion transporter [Candidatus Limnocylindrales bacterium]
MGLETDETRTAEEPNELYELFIGILTLFALGVMVVELLASAGPVIEVLSGIDALLCLLFVADFARSLRRAPVKRAYLWPYGVVDLLGSVPGVGPLALLRLFRLSRLSRATRSLQGEGPRHLVRQFVRRRSEAALYVIILSSLAVLTIGSLLVASVEPGAVGSNIRTGGDAFWWAFVTITTVGYGDRFPVTPEGRIVGGMTMLLGIGVFAVFTGYLSGAFLGGRAPDARSASDQTTAAELVALRAEVGALREALLGRDGRSDTGPIDAGAPLDSGGASRATALTRVDPSRSTGGAAT